eukprot:scaffold1843_cov232-Chaetoceros_neogracile.AAC.2
MDDAIHNSQGKSKIIILPLLMESRCTLSLHINNAVPEKSKVYINPSIASNIKAFSRDSSLKQTTLFPKSQKFTSIRQSLPISNHSAETVV